MSLSVFTPCLPHAYVPYNECALHKRDRNTIKRSFCDLQLKQMALKTDLHPLRDCHAVVTEPVIKSFTPIISEQMPFLRGH